MSPALVVNYFVTIFMLCSPLAAIPVFLSLSSGKTTSDRAKIAWKSGIAVSIVLVIATWFGGPVLNFLGIRISAFQIAGSIVVFLLALSMLNAEMSHMRHTDDENEKKGFSMAIVPLAIPVMAGPGALSAVIVSSHKYAGFLDHMILSAIAISVGGLCTLSLYFALPLEKKLGPSGLNIVTRIGGLILAAMAVEILVSGLEGLGLLASSS